MLRLLIHRCSQTSLVLLLLAGAASNSAAGHITNVVRNAVPAPEWRGQDEDRPAQRYSLKGDWWWWDPRASEAVEILKAGGHPVITSTGAYDSQSGAYARPGGGFVYEPERRPRPSTGATGTVSGYLYEQENRRPVPHAYVTLISTEPEYEVIEREAHTDSSGLYVFQNVEPGRWAVDVLQDKLPAALSARRLGRIVTVAPRQAATVSPLFVTRTACVAGHAAWGDGYVLYDAPVTVAPFDSTYFSTGGLLNGLGDFNVCGAPSDSVMVWMHLRDGRSLGRTVRLDPAKPKRVEFQPEPVEKMEGCLLRVQPVTNSGEPVAFAKITVVGRRFEQGTRPALVYVREETADRGGIAEFRVPFGVYEVLAINPREGQVGRVERMVVNFDSRGVQPFQVVLRGRTTPEERAAIHLSLLDRAESYLYIWTQ